LTSKLPSIIIIQTISRQTGSKIYGIKQQCPHIHTSGHVIGGERRADVMMRGGSTMVRLGLELPVSSSRKARST
jgi:hypothetical protein